MTDKTSDAASFALARFLTRPDVKDQKMASTIDWALEQLTDQGGRPHTKLYTAHIRRAYFSFQQILYLTSM